MQVTIGTEWIIKESAPKFPFRQMTVARRGISPSLSHLLIFLTLVLAAWYLTGVFGPPEPQDRPIYVNFSNTDNTSHTFELWIAEGTELSGIRVRRATGGDYNGSEGHAGISTHDPGPHTAMSLEFPADVQLYGRYTLPPNGSVDWTMAEPYGQTVFVVVVYGHDRVTTWVSVSCDTSVLYHFGVVSTDYGGYGGYFC